MTRWKLRYDGRYTAPLLITSILIGGHLSFGILESYRAILLAIFTALVAEVVLSRLLRDRWPHLASAYISGISVGILIRTPLYWPFVVCSLLTITSKYVLRFRGRHLWNPSNFGICAMLFLAPHAVAPLSVQWGNNLWPMLVIWILGSVIIWRFRRFHICATYVAAFLLFAFVRTFITGDSFLAEVAPLTGPMYQLFVFFMITDPKTTVTSKPGQAVVAFAVALVETVLRLAEVVHAPFYALFIVGPVALLIEMAFAERRTRQAVSAGARA
ncbi:RnfABCDGE type electron transport complex subunit D [Rhodocaloribacter litoris]|uniref:RnfABCDGE type electron transport complex subunit D n=1 Tax=Rhodocaloribacter litoris TaxID=2558931 RepID=UPI00141F69B7|nr:RnfABCDGE type electron transport complex subunit D [Rhodocaloribacter litoris]QXD13757.1 RnfABCDGE type electron transport complex subunit D [Rhodocaloribacter litoris]